VGVLFSRHNSKKMPKNVSEKWEKIPQNYLLLGLQFLCLPRIIKTTSGEKWFKVHHLPMEMERDSTNMLRQDKEAKNIDR